MYAKLETSWLLRIATREPKVYPSPSQLTRLDSDRRTLHITRYILTKHNILATYLVPASPKGREYRPEYQFTIPAKNERQGRQLAVWQCKIKKQGQVQG
jgi:hypothetical protein